MNNLTLTDLSEYVKIYVCDMLTEYLINETESIPQTLEDYVDCLNLILERGIMGPTGIGSVSINQFYYLEDGNILERISTNAMDDILESIYNNRTSSQHIIDPTNLTQICELYINLDLYNTIRLVIDDVRERVEMARLMINAQQ
jgi:hypothetical protein